MPKLSAAVANDLWAALDLGSNSFHLLIVRPLGASFVVVERLKEKVQLLGGFTDGEIQVEARQRGLECLARFAQRLTPIPDTQIQVMGTYALRQARNADDFVSRAEQILHAPVQIISGAEEARLIYQAVNHHVTSSASNQCTVDIGGGSTEISLGMGPQLAAAISVDLGCVAFKDHFFSAATSQSAAYRSARKLAVAVLTENLAKAPQFNAVLTAQRSATAAWFGTSGTIQSIATVLSANGWTHDAITRDAIANLETAIVEDRWILQAGLPGLDPDRADIFAGGVAILSACFEVLGIQSLQDVDVSLLQGMISNAVFAEGASGDVAAEQVAELMKEDEMKEQRMKEQQVQNQPADLREDSVAQLTSSFMVDRDQARRVENCVLILFEQAQPWWQELRSQAPELLEDYQRLLLWAARLHEVGAHISHRHYHRHGGYIIKHTAMPGFSDLHKSMLALLVRGHRRSMPGLAFQAFSDDIAVVLLHLVVLLRIAVILQRSHSDADMPSVSLRVNGAQIELDCGAGWLAQHPLSARELVVERQQLATAGLQLTVL